MKLPLLSIIFILLVSCIEENTRQKAVETVIHKKIDIEEPYQEEEKKDFKDSSKIKIVHFDSLEKAKNFSIKKIKPCKDIDLHGYKLDLKIYNKEINDSKIIVDFSFNKSCDLTYKGDYFIKNNTLFIKVKNISSDFVHCHCKYYYRFEAQKLERKVTKVKVLIS